MKSLSVLSKFSGWYNIWKDIKENYQLKWPEDNSITTFQNLFNEDKTYHKMLGWLKTSINKIHLHMEIS